MCEYAEGARSFEPALAVLAQTQGGTKGTCELFLGGLLNAVSHGSNDEPSERG